MEKKEKQKEEQGKKENKDGKILRQLVPEKGQNFLNGNKEGEWTYVGLSGATMISYGIVNDKE